MHGSHVYKSHKYVAGLVDSGKLSQEGASAKNAHKAYLLADAMVAERDK